MVSKFYLHRLVSLINICGVQLFIHDLTLPGHAIPLASNISFEARAGELTCIAMPSPAAATALSLTLSAHLRASSGTITCSDGHALTGRAVIVDSPGVNELEDMRQAAAYARELLAYQPGPSPRNFFTRHRLTSLTQRNAQLGRKPLGIDLSVRQRIRLMCAITEADCTAEIVVFDTPYRNCISQQDREDVTHELQQLASTGRIVIAVTHEVSEELYY